MSLFIIASSLNHTAQAYRTDIPDPSRFEKGTPEYEQEMQEYREWQAQRQAHRGDQYAADNAARAEHMQRNAGDGANMSAEEAHLRAQQALEMQQLRAKQQAELQQLHQANK